MTLLSAYVSASASVKPALASFTCEASCWRRIEGVPTNLVLDKELDTLNGSGSGLRDGSGDTTHYRIVSTVVLFPSRGSELLSAEVLDLRPGGDGIAVGTLPSDIGADVLKKSTTKPGMPMKDFLLWSTSCHGR